MMRDNHAALLGRCMAVCALKEVPGWWWFAWQGVGVELCYLQSLPRLISMLEIIPQMRTGQTKALQVEGKEYVLRGLPSSIKGACHLQETACRWRAELKWQEEKNVDWRQA